MSSLLRLVNPIEELGFCVLYQLLSDNLMVYSVANSPNFKGYGLTSVANLEHTLVQLKGLSYLNTLQRFLQHIQVNITNRACNLISNIDSDTLF